MPKLFEADVLPPAGVLRPQQRELAVSRLRNERYASQYAEMRRAGIKIPLFWGHQMKRGGPHHHDDRATERARWQAGDLEDLRVDPATGRLRTVAPVPPGLDIDAETNTLIDPVNHTRHPAVSIGIGDWTDGTGKVWEDVPLHVAITPLPVWVWQSGFELSPDGAMALGDGGVKVKFVLGGNMPIPKPEDEDEVEKPAADAPAVEPPEEEAGAEPAPAEAPLNEGESAPDMAEGEGGGGPEADEAAGQDAEPELGEMPEEGEDAEAADLEPKDSPIVELANKLGIEVPEGTTSENIESVMVGIFSGLIAAGAKISVGGGEHDLEPKGGEGGNKPYAEAPPMFMLGDNAATPAGMTDREWGFAQKLMVNRQQAFRDRCEALIGRGMPADLVNEVRERGTRFHLSADGDVSIPDAEGDLSLMERMADRVGPLLTATLSTADPKPKASPNPARGGNPDPHDAEYKAWLTEQAEKAYGKGAVPATFA